jgi:hypothetical protein
LTGVSRNRRHTAIACVIAALAVQIVLPCLHAIVHQLEDAVARAHARRWRVEGSRTAAHRHHHDHEHGDHTHEHGPRERPRHEHPGDERGRHGVDAPEHLHAMLLPAAMVIVPPPFRPASKSDVRIDVASVAPAPTPTRDHNRGPPRVV